MFKAGAAKSTLKTPLNVKSVASGQFLNIKKDSLRGLIKEIRLHHRLLETQLIDDLTFIAQQSEQHTQAATSVLDVIRKTQQEDDIKEKIEKLKVSQFNSESLIQLQQELRSIEKDIQLAERALAQVYPDLAKVELHFTQTRDLDGLTEDLAQLDFEPPIATIEQAKTAYEIFDDIQSRLMTKQRIEIKDEQHALEIFEHLNTIINLELARIKIEPSSNQDPNNPSVCEQFSPLMQFRQQLFSENSPFCSPHRLETLHKFYVLMAFLHTFSQKYPNAYSNLNAQLQNIAEHKMDYQCPDPTKPQNQFSINFEQFISTDKLMEQNQNGYHFRMHFLDCCHQINDEHNLSDFRKNIYTGFYEQELNQFIRSSLSCMRQLVSIFKQTYEHFSHHHQLIAKTTTLSQAEQDQDKSSMVSIKLPSDEQEKEGISKMKKTREIRQPSASAAYVARKPKAQPSFNYDQRQKHPEYQSTELKELVEKNKQQSTQQAKPTRRKEFIKLTPSTDEEKTLTRKSKEGLSFVQTTQPPKTQKNNDFTRFENTCADECLEFIAKKYGLIVDFETEKYSNDEQIELHLLAQINDITLTGIEHYDGKNQQGIKKWLANLDPAFCYQIRTGTNDGAGHYSVMSYGDDGWEYFDSNRLPIKQVLDKQGNLTPEASGKFIVANHQWGKGKDEYSIMSYQIPKTIVMDLVKAVKTFRI